jgi:hypothetical protein
MAGAESSPLAQFKVFKPSLRRFTECLDQLSTAKVTRFGAGKPIDGQLCVSCVLRWEGSGLGCATMAARILGVFC